MIDIQPRFLCALAVLLLATGAMAGEAPTRAAGMATVYAGGVGDTILEMTIARLTPDHLSGSIDEIWIDADGHQLRARAAFEGIVSSGHAQLFLRYENVMRIAFAPRVEEDGGNWAIDPRDFAGATSPLVLTAGWDARVRDLTDAVRANRVFGEGMSAGAGLSTPANQGCQCSDQKKSRVAEHTRLFSGRVAQLAQKLERYGASLDINSASLKRIREHDLAMEDAYPGARTMTEVLDRAGIAFALQIEALHQECRQRPLSSDEAKTPEEKSWTEACNLVAGIGAQLNDRRDRFRRSLVGLGID